MVLVIRANIDHNSNAKYMSFHFTSQNTTTFDLEQRPYFTQPIYLYVPTQLDLLFRYNQIDSKNAMLKLNTRYVAMTTNSTIGLQPCDNTNRNQYFNISNYYLIVACTSLASEDPNSTNACQILSNSNQCVYFTSSNSTSIIHI